MNGDRRSGDENSVSTPRDQAPGPDYSGPGVEAELQGELRASPGPETIGRVESHGENGPPSGGYDELYTARACSAGRRVSTDDGLLDVPVEAPEALGGPGRAPNPEQLLAAAYAACF